MEKFLVSLDVWKKKHAPWAGTPAGWAVLMWLLRSNGQTLPLKCLYLDGRFSEPTLRAALRLFVLAGVATIETPHGDHRVSLVSTTAKFEEVLTQLSLLVDEAQADKPSPGAPYDPSSEPQVCCPA